ncbi:unnamed protein product [Musa acuminata subsp. malaccensis]|uniref:(wild Malaysian banana) hypothetical protein n=1 Tax=Musa acuminata subsp. malaccensis TaxID=214687 RepID=A0A804J6E6_MUSAM|nr:unnamed protein product [Musa acuminata subsp. malaccensis]
MTCYTMPTMKVVQVYICNYEVYDYDPINKVPHSSSA